MYDLELKTAKSLAQLAGDIMRQYFYGNQQLEIKNDGTPLTIADTTINQLVIDQLAESFPADVVIGEEASTGDYGLGRRWLCDPIDGTKAFTWGVPTAMFSLALVVDGKPVLGVGYEPMTDQLYWAVEGRGSYCNQRRLAVNKADLASGVVAVMSDADAIRQSVDIGSLVDRGVRTASFSGAVAKTVRVAEGRFIGYVDQRVNPYDMAAVDIIVREAGGKITDRNGLDLNYLQSFKGAVVSNGLVHEELLDIIAQ